MVVGLSSPNFTLLAGFRDDNPYDQVRNQSGDAAGDQSDDKRQAEPEGADTEEFGQTATDTGNNTVVPGTSQGSTSLTHLVTSKK